jgi:hypothetical protein
MVKTGAEELFVSKCYLTMYSINASYPNRKKKKRNILLCEWHIWIAYCYHESNCKRIRMNHHPPWRNATSECNAPIRLVSAAPLRAWFYTPQLQAFVHFSNRKGRHSKLELWKMDILGIFLVSKGSLRLDGDVPRLNIHFSLHLLCWHNCTNDLHDTLDIKP